jgi:hypothetical protein
MVKLDGLEWRPRYDEHMGCIKGCLEYLGLDVSFPWLYGGTAHAFVLNMNETVFVDCAMAWDTASVYDLYPNLGYTRSGLHYDPGMDDAASPERFRQAQRKAWDFVRARIDRDIPCYGWELSYIPSYWVINGYDDVGYYYSGYHSGGPCPWDKLGTFDVHVVSVHAIEPCPAAADDAVVRDALSRVLDCIERPDGWALSPRYRTGLPAYEMWADALETGIANRDGHSYINQVWLECRKMAVAFLQEAQSRLPGRCDRLFEKGAEHYAGVCKALQALLEMHPERPREQIDWQSTFGSPEGAAFVRQAAVAERQGADVLRQIVAAL